MFRKVSLTINTGVKDIEIGQNVNYTREADPIFQRVGIENFDSLNGKKADEVAKVLFEALEEVKTNKEALEKEYSSDSFTGAITFLRSVYNICVENPACTVKIS